MKFFFSFPPQESRMHHCILTILFYAHMSNEATQFKKTFEPRHYTKSELDTFELPHIHENTPILYTQ